jgi:hypothetical protein
MRILSCVTVALWLAAPLPAYDNLVVNGGFDSDLSGWSSGLGASAWSPEDAGGGTSGSALLSCDDPAAGTACDPIMQCVAVAPGPHLLRAAFRTPGGQSRTGDAYLIAYAYAGAGCSGGPVAGGFSTTSVDSVAWTTEGVLIDVPPSGGSVSIRTQVFKLEAGGVFDALFDDVELIPGYLFDDRFESGDLSAWSSSVP